MKYTYQTQQHIKRTTKHAQFSMFQEPQNDSILGNLLININRTKAINIEPLPQKTNRHARIWIQVPRLVTQVSEYYDKDYLHPRR